MGPEVWPRPRCRPGPSRAPESLRLFTRARSPRHGHRTGTGSAGGVGAWTVNALADAGREVVAVDREAPPTDERRDNVDYVAADLTDYGETRQAVDAAAPDAVVHLAAIPHPEDHAGSRVFGNNVESAYNVFDAAGAAGARIAWASSESCYGTAFAAGDWLPDRLPIDEATPTEPEDPCGLSKVVGEAVAASAARRHGVPAVSLRLSWVTYPDDERRREARETFDPATAEPSGNCWSSVDVRDVVAAIEADSHRSATSTATSPSSTARRRGGCSGGS